MPDVRSSTYDNSTAPEAGAPLPPSTFEETYRRYAARSSRVATRLFGEIGEDIAAEAMLRLFRNYPTLDCRADLWPWLYRVMLNIGRSHHRANSRLLFVDGPTLVELGPVAAD